MQMIDPENARTLDPAHVGGAGRTLPKAKAIIARPVESTEEAQEMVEGIVNESYEEALVAKMTVLGDPELDVGQIINVGGVPKMVAGNYYIQSVKHSLSGSGYQTTLDIRRDATGEIPGDPEQQVASPGEPNVKKPTAPTYLDMLEAIDPDGQTTRIGVRPSNRPAQGGPARR